MFGGRTGGQELNDLWRYNGASNAWERLEPQGGPPPGRWGHGAVYDVKANRMLVISGQSPRGFFNDVWAYEASTNRWVELRPSGNAPNIRYGAGVAYNPQAGSVYLTHGFTDKGRFDDTWTLDAQGNAWRDVSAQGPRPRKRCLLEAAYDPVQDRVLLFGGQSNEIPFLGDLWAYDPRSGAWREVPVKGPEPRHFASMVVDSARSQALVFGGQSAQGPLADLWSLDLRTSTWKLQSAAGAGPSARHGHDAAYDGAGQRMFIFGGLDSAERNDLWALDLGA